MKKVFCVLILLCFTALGTIAQTVKVPKDTKVLLGMKRTKSQRTISGAGKLNVVIRKDVFINGKLVFKKGDKAVIYVQENKKAKFLCKGGKLVLSDGYATDVNGNQHDIKFSREYIGKDAPWVAKLIIFKKGQNVVIPITEDFPVTTKFDFNL